MSPPACEKGGCVALTQRSPGSVGETRCLRWQCLVRIPSERGQTKASTRNCERKPTTRRATGARKSGRKVVTVDPMHTKAQTCNSNLIRGPCSSSGRGPVRFRRLLNLRKAILPPLRTRPRRFAAQLVTSRAEARRVCCSRGWVVCCSDGSGDHDDRSCVAFAYGRAVWMGPEAPWRVFVGAW